MRWILACLAFALAAANDAQPRPPALVGCWAFTSGRESLPATSGGGFGTLPPAMVLTDSLLFAREGDPTYVLRATTTSDSANDWSAKRLVGTWHPHADSVFANFSDHRSQSGIAVRFRIFRDSLDGMARPYTQRTRWEPDVPVSARRVRCAVTDRR
jgi:hypothetical protein